ncbi:YaaC family protein [Ponticoccus sp. (in: a-proteobacteria)]|uniref:YaaC family protein n=1 Tax=Ponticoccus sp. (in: a-proteobacteria) TaxID=1925025 RepID=UPI003AB44A69
MHKGIVDPDFSAEHVLSRDPWLYVELWLKRQRKHEALSYWLQARRFAEASSLLDVQAAPLTMYYAFLNASKALLTQKGLSKGKHHGVSGSRPEDARASLATETVNFQTGGVLPDLCGYLGESTQKTSYSLKDILWNIPFVHRAFLLTFTSTPELFIPLEQSRYIRESGTREVWFEAQIIPRFTDKRKLVNIPPSFEHFERDGNTYVRRKKRCRFCMNQDSADDKIRANTRLRNYHAQTRRVIVNITGNRDLWYLKRAHYKNEAGSRHTMSLMFAAMHRLSELSRYDPKGLESHLNGQANWLISEFVYGSMDQFIDQISSEITGRQFWPPKVR